MQQRERNVPDTFRRREKKACLGKILHHRHVRKLPQWKRSASQDGAQKEQIKTDKIRNLRRGALLTLERGGEDGANWWRGSKMPPPKKKAGSLAETFGKLESAALAKGKIKCQGNVREKPTVGNKREKKKRPLSAKGRASTHIRSRTRAKMGNATKWDTKAIKERRLK